MKKLLNTILLGLAASFGLAGTDSLLFCSPDLASQKLTQELSALPQNDSSAISQNLISQGRVELLRGNFPLAIRYALKSRNYCLHNQDLLARTYLLESSTYLASDKLLKAKELLGSIDDGNQIDLETRAVKWLLSGRVYVAQGQHEKAQSPLLKAMSVFQKKGVWYREIEGLLSLSELYTSQGRHTVALDALRRALQKSQKYQARVYECAIYHRLSILKHLQNQPDSTSYYIEKAVELAHETHVLHELNKIYFSLYTYAIDRGDANLALRYFQQHKLINDSLYNVNRDREMATLDALHQIDVQKQENELLRQKAQLNQKEIGQQRKNVWIFMVCAIVLLIAMTITVVFYLRSRKANQRLLKIAHILKRKRDKLKLATSNLQLANKRLVKAQKIIVRQKEEVEKASQAKDVFLSTVSHELRTPLNAILGLTEGLIESEQDAEKRESLDVVKFSGENLLALVNDILDFNKIEAGKVEFETIDFNLRETLVKLEKAHEPRAQKNGVLLSLTYSSDAPEWYKGDPVRVGQVFNNLLSNAIKFTHQGQVAVIVELENATGDDYRLKCSVKDTGIGIPENKQSAIFERFTQASPDTTRKYGGTGLGLAITKRLVEMMGGCIQLQSTPGEGTCFTFWMTLKVGKPPLATVHQQSIQLPEGLRILLADDNASNRLLARNVLKGQPIVLDIVENGFQVLEKIGDQDNYDILLTDIHMPEMGGLDLVRNLRANGFWQPILALTGSMAKTMEQWKSLGFDDFLHKPYSKHQLLDLISQHIQK